MASPLQSLLDVIEPAIAGLAAGLASAASPTRLGLRRAARLPVAAALHRRQSAPVLLISDRADHALTLTEELALWAPDAMRLIFPEPNPLFYENAAWGESTRRDRLLVLTSLAAYHIPGTPPPPAPPLIIAPARAVMTRTIPRRAFLSAARTLKTGQTVRLEELARAWFGLGYESVHTVISPGQFARRGGILDLWPLSESHPVRIEFFGDEIETLRFFDPATQRTLPAGKTSGPQRILVTPAREYLLPAELDLIPPDPRSAQVADEVAGEISEFHIPLLHAQPASLLDYLPPTSLVLLDDLQALEDSLAEIEEQSVQQRQESIANQTLRADFPIPYLTWSELQDPLARYTTVEARPLHRPGSG